VRELERTDVSAYLKLGYRTPKPFRAVASDGKTEIHGVLMYPTNFDPAKKYPVIDAIYPGPQVIKAPKRYQAGAIEQAIAEMGFIVIQIDGLGTPGRSKVFHDIAYANMANGGDLASHVAGLRQLVKDHPYLDLDRVGIFGHSGGGFASARAMLLHPDFFKVAVSSAGNHDQLGYLYSWGEKYQGPVNGTNYDGQENARLAANLKGRLLLAYGDMDDNVSPALTVQLIDALTKANKDYDLIVIPNGNHRFSVNPYFNRRRWDYFVKHLLGVEPPAGFQIKAVSSEP
jgi:dipeptidyl aminopeptidase/acylaminoacyl peptidase